MTPWDHLDRLFSLGPVLAETVRFLGYAALLAALGIFLLGLARFIDLFRPK